MMQLIQQPLKQFLLITVLALFFLGYESYQQGDFISLWLTPDQQGQITFNQNKFPEAAMLFTNSEWQGTANYEAGTYETAASSFARRTTADAFFNRGNALMKARKYRQAVSAYEQAVAANPEWEIAQDNLELSQYVTQYIERAREQGDTGDESELGADGYEFDKQSDGGEQMTVTKQSTIALESAQKWMQGVDTDTSEYLQIRFRLQSAMEDAAQ